MNPYLLLAVFWVLYCAFHSLTAALWFKRWAASWMGRFYRAYRVLYNAIAVWMAVALIRFQFSIDPTWLFPPTLFTQLSGGVLMLNGVGIVVVALRNYSAEFFGVKKLLGQEPEPSLVQTGLLSRVRHPLYLGTLLVIWGGVVLDPRLSHLLVDIILTLYVFIGIVLEERKLILQFGDTYRQYRQRVPMLLPRIGSEN
ncbi:MAG: isoprenylcysteine carboxylmethyltransferase family protein [Cytophagaceae bacterium]|nr:isoprenylcysteine carboxylmethyltransferase family protein [Cytophagaceae bacterium]